MNNKTNTSPFKKENITVWLKPALCFPDGISYPPLERKALSCIWCGQYLSYLNMMTAYERVCRYFVYLLF